MRAFSPRRRLQRLLTANALVLMGVAFLFSGFFTLSAETRALQPRLRIVVSDDSEAMTEQQSNARRLTFAAIEARFSGQDRYLISRTTTDLDPESYAADHDLSDHDVFVFLRLNPRLDGTMRFDFDVWKDGVFTRSGEAELPVGEERLSRVDTIAGDLVASVGELFPGFGRLRFTNRGFQQNYYVHINGADAIANLYEIDLPVGEYEIVIRRRDEGFSHAVGRRNVKLATDNFYEITFNMQRTTPPLPGYLRLTDPNDRWRGIFTLRGSGLIPVAGFGDQSMESGWSTTGTALFGDVPFRGFLLGIEAGYLRYEATEVFAENDATEVTIDLGLNMTPVFGVLGLTIGPVAGVDFNVRGGAGVAIYRYEVEGEANNVAVTEETVNRIDPAFNGTFEFGFGLGRHFRFSVHSALLGVLNNDGLHSWLQLGAGIGGRF